MLGLPKATEMNKQLPKNAIYAKFQMNSAAKERMDRDISRIYIVNEVSPEKVNRAWGEEVTSFFVVAVTLKRRGFDEKNLIQLSKLIPQNMVMVLAYESEEKLAIYRGRLLQTDWKPKGEMSLELTGLDLDKVWENIIVQIGGFTVADGNTIDEQIDLESQKTRLMKEMEKLEKLARKEKQPKKKFEMVQRLQEYKKRLDTMDRRG